VPRIIHVLGRNSFLFRERELTYQAASRTTSEIASSRYKCHGHAEGRQGPKGHDMVDSDALQQKGEYIYIPRAAFSGAPQNTQNMYSDGAGSTSFLARLGQLPSWNESPIEHRIGLRFPGSQVVEVLT